MYSQKSLATSTAISWKRRLLLNIERAMYWTGMGFAYVKLGQIKGATILMYHSVASSEVAQFIDPDNHVTPEVFESQMSFLAKNRQVISLSQLLKQLQQRQTPQAGTVVITFDDGYLDQMTVAAPIMKHYGIPATWYIPTGMIHRGENPWIDIIYTAFKTRSKHTLSLEGIGSWDLSNSQQLFTAYNHIKERLLLASYSDREKIIFQLVEQIQPTKISPRLLLSWEEIREVTQKFPNIEMGLHSCNHIDYSTHSRKLVNMDFQQCLADFRRELGQEPVNFAFPYNRHSTESREMLLNCGLHSAMGSNDEALITTSSNNFALPRIDPRCSMTLFRFYTSGAFPGLPKKLLNRAA